MKRSFSLMRLTLLYAALALAGCADQPLRQRNDDAFRRSQPVSILVLPPANGSPDVRAPYSVLATVTRPLAEAGYYVYPVALVEQTFREHGLAAPGEAQQVEPAKLREMFGADTALYLEVEKYGASFALIDSVVEVEASGRLVDLRTGDILWQGRASASDAENRKTEGSLLSMVVGAVVRQVVNSQGDPGYPVARMTMMRMLGPGSLPPGPHLAGKGKR